MSWARERLGRVSSARERGGLSEWGEREVSGVREKGVSRAREREREV